MHLVACVHKRLSQGGVENLAWLPRRTMSRRCRSQKRLVDVGNGTSDVFLLCGVRGSHDVPAGRFTYVLNSSKAVLSGREWISLLAVVVVSSARLATSAEISAMASGGWAKSPIAPQRATPKPTPTRRSMQSSCGYGAAERVLRRPFGVKRTGRGKCS